MAREVEGVVERISVKEIEDNNGDDVTLYSIKVDGEYYGTGRKKPKCKEGDTVRFEFYKKGKYFNADPDTVEILEAADDEGSIGRPPRRGRSSSRSSGSKSSDTTQTKNGFWDAKEQRDIEWRQRQQDVVEPRISHCSARDAAVQLVAACLEYDSCQPETKDRILPLPAAKGKRFDALQDIVDQVTGRFYDLTMSGQFGSLPAAEDIEQGEDDEDDEG